MRPRLVGVGGQRLRGREIQVALDRQIQPAAYRREFREAHRAEFRTAHAEVTQAEGDIRIVRIDFGEEPSAAGVRREQLHDGQEVGFGLAGQFEVLTKALVQIAGTSKYSLVLRRADFRSEAPRARLQVQLRLERSDVPA